jgi:hypothetical protein
MLFLSSLPPDSHISPLCVIIDWDDYALVETFHVISVHAEFGFDRHSRGVTLPVTGWLLDLNGS